MRRRLLWIVSVLAVLITAAALPAFAQDPDAEVRPDTLNMRSGPGSDYSVVIQLSRGAPLELIAQDDSDGNGVWVFARTTNGVEGWVMSDYLIIRADLDLSTLPMRSASAAASAAPAPVSAEPSAAQPASSFPEGTGIPAETLSQVNLRSGPGKTYSVLSTLPGGTSLLLQGRNETADWVFVSTNGQKGWVYYDFLRVLSGNLSSLPISNATGNVAAVPTSAPSDQNAAAQSAGVPAPVVSGGRGISSFGYGGHVESFAYPNLMQNAGMTWVKRQIRFSRGSSGSGVAGTINEAHAKGFKILLGIVGSPSEVMGGGYFEDYARFVGEVAALGPDAIEVWNEMNIDREWPTGQINPTSYTQLLALAYNAIKSANPNVVVISGAPAPTGAEGAFGTGAVWNDDRYIRGMAAAGAASYMDCVGAHYNEGIVGPRQNSGDPRGEYYTRYFNAMVNTYWSAFGGARPVCFTELGYLSPEGFGPLPGSFAWGADTTVAEQAAWLADAVSLARGSGRVKLVIIWNVDFTGYGSDPMAGYAIVRPGGVCPACTALAGVR